MLNNTASPAAPAVKFEPADALITPSNLPPTRPVRTPEQFAFAPFSRGKYVAAANGEVTFTGKWAMNKDQLEVGKEGTVNDCEFNGSNADGRPTGFKGHFMMYQKKANKKYTETLTDVTFESTDDAVQNIYGRGSNLFGPFQLEGTLDTSTNVLEFYKFYDPPKPKVARKKVVKKSPADRKAIVAASASLTAALPSRGSGRKKSINKKYTETLSEPERALTGNLKAMQGILLKLMSGGPRNAYKSQVAIIFLDPVNLEQFPEYLDTIAPSKPICFMDVKRKLYTNMYDSYLEFATDVRRIFHNAFIFNATEKAGAVYSTAVNLSTFFEKEFAKVHATVVAKEEEARRLELEREEQRKLAEAERARAKAAAAAKKKADREKKKMRDIERKRKQRERERKKKELELQRAKRKSEGGTREKSSKRQKTSRPPRVPRTTVSGANDTLLLGQIEYLQEQIDKLTKNQSVVKPSGGSNRKRAPKQEKTNWSYQDKEQLTEQINQILTDDEKYMQEIMDIIKKHSNALGDDEEGEIELDIDNLSIQCLNELHKYVSNAKQKIRRRNANENTRRKRAEEKAKKAHAAQMANAAVGGFSAGSHQTAREYQGGIRQERVPDQNYHRPGPSTIYEHHHTTSSVQQSASHGDVSEEEDEGGLDLTSISGIDVNNDTAISSSTSQAWASLANDGVGAANPFESMHQESSNPKPAETGAASFGGF